MLRQGAGRAGYDRQGAGEKFSPAGPSAPPSIILPKGGGAIRSIDETFSTNPVTGTATLNIRISTPPGRQAFSPQLMLSYDSGAGNGPFGIGWQLSVPGISRKTDKGIPPYRDAEDSDTFLLSGAEDLVPVLIEQDGDWQGDISVRSGDGGAELFTVQSYRPRIEGLFARIECWHRQSDGDVHWRATSEDNVTSVYGRSREGRIIDPADNRRIFHWLLEESFDDKGNVTFYEYKQETSDEIDPASSPETNRLTNQTAFANRYLKRVLYGNQTPHQRSGWMFEIIFDYGEHDPDNPTPTETRPWPVRLDPFSSYRAGFEIRTYRLCRRVL